MLTSIIQPEIEQLLAERRFSTIKDMLASMDPPDVVELLGQLPDDDMAMVFRLLAREPAAEVFGDLEIDRQEKLLTLLSSTKVTRVVNNMPPDERTELLEELPGQLAQKLLNSLSGDQRKIAHNLLAYPEDSIGRLMTTEYVAIRSDWSIARVLDHIRKVGRNKETLNVIFVVDSHWKLLGDVALEDIVLADPDGNVADVFGHNVVALEAREDREFSVEAFRKYGAVALPVVDGVGTLVGIVTVDDVMDVAEEETTEDIQKMAGMAALEYSYFATGFLKMILKRLPWLVMLLGAQMLTTLALTKFQNSFIMFPVLVVFMPLVNSPAGNTGSQAATLMIRGLAVQEIAMGDWHRVLLRELLHGLLLGVALAVVGFLAATLFGPMLQSHTPVDIERIALSVAIAITAAVTLANLIGSMLPFFFKLVGLDPAVTSGPFIASTMDVLGIIVYFTTAMTLVSTLT
jgi:magnesium transporter